MKTELIAEAEETRRGEMLARILNLKKCRENDGADKDRYFTQWGTKSPLGLYRTVERIMAGDDQ